MRARALSRSVERLMSSDELAELLISPFTPAAANIILFLFPCSLFSPLLLLQFSLRSLFQSPAIDPTASSSRPYSIPFSLFMRSLLRYHRSHRIYTL